MKVTFRVSGGIAQIDHRCDLDTEAMASQEGAELEALVNGCPLRKTPWRLPGALAFDLLHYTIRVKKGRAVATYRFDDTNIPVAAAGLVKFLWDRSSPRPR